MSTTIKNTQTTYVCSIPGCSKTFSKKLYLDQHIRQHTGERPFHCTNEGCGKTYSRKDHLHRHLKWCSVSQSADPIERLTCSEDGCLKTFQNSQNLRVHLRNVHERSKRYRCAVESCGKVFKKHHGLKQHEFEHSGINPFSCMQSGCNKSFRIFSHFKRHMKVHDGYTCDQCGETFEKWTQLIRHKSTHHRPPQKCPHCDKTFASKLCLRKHVRVHSATQEVFVCSHDGCGRYYTMKRNLIAHIKSYHDGRRFPCTHEGCSRSFPFKHKMLEHVKNHTCIRPLKKKYPKKGHRKRSMASRLSGYIPPTVGSTCNGTELDSPLLQENTDSPVISSAVTENIVVSLPLDTGPTSEFKTPNRPDNISAISPVSNDGNTEGRSRDIAGEPQDLHGAEKEGKPSNLKPPPRETVIHLIPSKSPGNSQGKQSHTTKITPCCGNTNQDTIKLNSPLKEDEAEAVNKIKASRIPLPTTNIKFADPGNKQSASSHKEVTRSHLLDSNTPSHPSQISVKRSTNKYICSVNSCGKEFVSASSLKIHLFYHTEMRCSGSMDSSAKQQMDNILYSTKDCVEVFRSSKTSSEHQPWNSSSSGTAACFYSSTPSHHSSQTANQSPNQKYQLPSCTATTAQGPTYLHQKLLCSICGDIFFSSSLLSQHLRSHPSAARNSFNCPKPGCGQVFLEKSKLDSHVKDHSSHRSKPHPIFQCPLTGCDMTFKSQSQLKTHSNLHSIKKYSKSKQKLAKIILGKYF